MQKRRRIGKWTRQAEANKDHECTKCDTIIYTGSVYERIVMASPKKLTPENYHIYPPCADAYYTGN